MDAFSQFPHASQALHGKPVAQWLHAIMIFQAKNAGLMEQTCYSEHTFLQLFVLLGLFDHLNYTLKQPSKHQHVSNLFPNKNPPAIGDPPF